METAGEIASEACIAIHHVSAFGQRLAGLGIGAAQALGARFQEERRRRELLAQAVV